MSPDEFRRLALSLPETIEGTHMGHPDFRVAGKIFATLGSPDASHGMVKLRPEDQEMFMRVEPDVFAPAKGGWGRAGSTLVALKRANAATLRDAMVAAWRSAAPKRLEASID